MVMLAALGLMSLLWMSVVAVLVTAQKFLPVNAVVDVSLALAIVALGVLIVVAPATVPGLTPAM
jgi:predicted metal-binding membrane protein